MEPGRLGAGNWKSAQDRPEKISWGDQIGDGPVHRNAYALAQHKQEATEPKGIEPRQQFSIIVKSWKAKVFDVQILILSYN